ncbi:MAG: tRNA (adenosine(37)-N6)-dimethylallyltransferase MiaA [Gammaproteobacteria bacterium]|nr:tRNA (adenosine(37)-N6)-dimethylallyltransferase MiaA [Gammaproteobacteria bacterium]
MGPTASGKTSLAVALARHLPCDIISVDSALVYKGMDIGTAKPDEKTLTEAPHRLIDMLDPRETYSAAQFREDALREMADITNQGRIPLLVGGTMLYYRALQYGLSEMPSADPAIRARLDKEAEAKGWAHMHARLGEVDPESAARLHPNDPQRIQRALEVYELTGISMTEYHRQQKPDPIPYHLFKLAVIPEDRAILHERISQRFDDMLAQGFMDEVKHLYARDDLNTDMPAIRTVGYRQVWEHLEGKWTYEEMIEKAKTATRNLAKRQHTWLRSEQDVTIFESTDLDILPKVLKFLEDIPT